MSYRQSLAYVRGVEDGLGENTSLSETYRDRARWVWTVERVRARLRLHEPLMEEFFARYYALDSGAPRHTRRRGETMLRVAADMNVGVSTLYKWREQILDQLVLAATQAGVLEPY